MRRFSGFILVLLLAACSATPSTRMPATPTIAAGLQSTDMTQPPQPTPTMTEFPLTATPATAGAMPTVLPRLEVSSPVVLATIHMIDLDIGWGIEKSGHIVRTRDGGETWQDVTPPQGLYNADGFFALDANLAWATQKPSDSCEDSRITWSDYQACMPGPNAVIWRTVDGGKTWQASEPYEVEDQHYKPIAVQFLDADTGWFFYVSSFGPMGSTTMGMAKTEDGGVSWTRVDAPQSMCIHREIVFMDARDGWSGADCRFTPTVGWPLQDFVSGKSTAGLGPLAPVLSQTRDGSRSWDYTTLPSPQAFPAELTSPNADPNISILCGTTNMERITSEAFTLQWTCSSRMGTPFFEDFSYQYLTSDHGQTWHSWLATGNESFLNAQTGWRLYSPGAGQAGQLQRTVDGGRVWKTIKTVAWQSAQFDFISEQVGWAVVNGGDVTTLAHTSDGGETWLNIHPMVRADAGTQSHTAMFLGNLQRTGVYETDSTKAITGKLKWKRPVDRSSASPAVLDGNIYYGSMIIDINSASTTTTTKFLSMDIDSGQIKWSFFPDLWWFTDVGPAIADGAIYFNDIGDVGNSTTTCFYALDLANGVEKWKACMAGYALWSSPAISQGVVYMGGKTELWALDARTGQAKWVLPMTTLGSPALADGVVYFHALRDNDDYLYALDADTGQEKWDFHMGPNYSYNWGGYTEGTPTISNGMVYLSGGSDYLYAVDARTGQEQWKLEAGRGIGSVVADGKTVYFVNSSSPQHVYAADAFTGKVNWKFNLGESQRTSVSPSLSNGVLYVGTNTGLYALDARTGQERWKYSEYEMIASPQTISSLVIADGIIYFAYGAYLYAIE